LLGKARAIGSSRTCAGIPVSSKVVQRLDNALTHHSLCWATVWAVTRDNTYVVACATPLNTDPSFARAEAGSGAKEGPTTWRRERTKPRQVNACFTGTLFVFECVKCARKEFLHLQLVLVRLHNVVAWHHAQSPQQRSKCACTAMRTNHGYNVMPFGSA
jgi:hypothetical protein